MVDETLGVLVVDGTEVIETTEVKEEVEEVV